ncbi:MAG: (2Fe-2S)-binding protein [Myxococcota bacterium]
MIVCHCNGVSDRTIRKAVRDGASSMGEISAACGAGSCCGGCASSVRQIMHTEFEAHDERSLPALPLANSTA